MSNKFVREVDLGYPELRVTGFIAAGFSVGDQTSPDTAIPAFGWGVSCDEAVENLIENEPDTVRSTIRVLELQ